MSANDHLIEQTATGLKGLALACGCTVCVPTSDSLADEQGRRLRDLTPEQYATLASHGVRCGQDGLVEEVGTLLATLGRLDGAPGLILAAAEFYYALGLTHAVALLMDLAANLAGASGRPLDLSRYPHLVAAEVAEEFDLAQGLEGGGEPAEGLDTWEPNDGPATGDSY